MRLFQLPVLREDYRLQGGGHLVDVAGLPVKAVLLEAIVPCAGVSMPCAGRSVMRLVATR